MHHLQKFINKHFPYLVILTYEDIDDEVIS